MIWFILGILVAVIYGAVTETLYQVIGILFVLATLVFFWGVIQFILKSDNEAERTKAKSIMTYGIVGLAVMASVWGITTILVQYFLGPGEGPTRGTIPTAPGKL